MTLETVIVYAAVLGLPLWLVIEEVLHRFASGAKVRAVAPATAAAADRRGSESVQAA
jgi:hypothetical protein